MNQPQSSSFGSYVFPSTIGKTPPSTIEELDLSVQVLQQKKDEWGRCSIKDRLNYLETLIHDFAVLSPRWVEQVASAQRIMTNDRAIGAEWSSLIAALRNLQCLIRALMDI